MQYTDRVDLKLKNPQFLQQLKHTIIKTEGGEGLSKSKIVGGKSVLLKLSMTDLQDIGQMRSTTLEGIL